MSSSLRHELADHIYQYLCHEARYSDLPEAAKESLTAASECIEQAYKLNVNSHQHSSSNTSSKTSDGAGGQQQQQQHQTKPADILPDELLRIFTRHKDFLGHQSTSSPATGGASSSDANTNTNLSPTLQQESGSELRPSRSKGSKLIGQHSLAAPGHHNNAHHHRHSILQKNFKQKIIALLKKLRTDRSGFDSEEQYREALERELMKAAAGRGSRAIEELLEEEIDVEEESGSASEPEDWDNISESSSPKPSLRPFFSSTTLDKI